MLIDRFLPKFDVSEVHEVVVDAPSDVAYDAIRQTDLRDPVIDGLFALRELPTRLLQRLRGSPPPVPRGPFTFDDMAKLDMGWMLLDEEPGTEFVVGSVGKFWQRDYGPKTVSAHDFISFANPGYAKLAISFSVRSASGGVATLRYEARTATTDETARIHFRRYWRLIRPGVAIVMRRVLRRIKVEAEHRAATATVEA
jgi:hypothetical protein